MQVLQFRQIFLSFCEEIRQEGQDGPVSPHWIEMKVNCDMDEINNLLISC